MEVFVGKDEVFPMQIMEAVLGDEGPVVRAAILRMWRNVLAWEAKNRRLHTHPEAEHIVSLIGWLETVAESL